MPDADSAAPDRIGERIREFRAIRDYSLSELGRQAHISPSMLSRIENGERSVTIGAETLGGWPLTAQKQPRTKPRCAGLPMGACFIYLRRRRLRRRRPGADRSCKINHSHTAPQRAVPSSNAVRGSRAPRPPVVTAARTVYPTAPRVIAPKIHRAR
ncbi:helix-turn-helix domain-containing protein [Streptomyces sp. TRM68367]|uniref:helix-turn-helix domain-containing protein n=1 Tax=Streptomyces sp. TRM68367 TaxID=2758415 RepID=UPI0021D35468|nr:helix-turn-helix transcriptional regulator [Streptomyces sp. TRM68367]